MLGLFQASHFCRVEFSPHEERPVFELICIEFVLTEMRQKRVLRETI